MSETVADPRASTWSLMGASVVGDRVEFTIRTTRRAIVDGMHEAMGAAAASLDAVPLAEGARLVSLLDDASNADGDAEVNLVVSVPRENWERLRGPRKSPAAPVGTG